MELKLVSPAGMIFRERLPSEANIGRMHYENLLFSVLAFEDLFHIINEADQKLLIREQLPPVNWFRFENEFGADD